MTLSFLLLCSACASSPRTITALSLPGGATVEVKPLSAWQPPRDCDFIITAERYGRKVSAPAHLEVSAEQVALVILNPLGSRELLIRSNGEDVTIEKARFRVFDVSPELLFSSLQLLMTRGKPELVIDGALVARPFERFASCPDTTQTVQFYVEQTIVGVIAHNSPHEGDGTE